MPIEISICLSRAGDPETPFWWPLPHTLLLALTRKNKFPSTRVRVFSQCLIPFSSQMDKEKRCPERPNCYEVEKIYKFVHSLEKINSGAFKGPAMHILIDWLFNFLKGYLLTCIKPFRW